MSYRVEAQIGSSFITGVFHTKEAADEVERMFRHFQGTLPHTVRVCASQVYMINGQAVPTALVEFMRGDNENRRQLGVSPRAVPYIKLVRELMNCSLREAKDFVDSILA
jgi:hypothetical protein